MEYNYRIDVFKPTLKQGGMSYSRWTIQKYSNIKSIGIRH